MITPSSLNSDLKQPMQVNLAELIFPLSLQDVTFAKVYNTTPHIFVSANHSTKRGNRSPIHNSITAWVEVG